ncbi:MAG: hypothetical protein ABW061_03495 [Polyangiaceae bacterium]
MIHRPRTLFLVIFGLTACGGRAIEAPGSGGSDSSEPDTDNSTPAANAGSAAASSKPLPAYALGDCTPGFSRQVNPNRPCNWLTKDGVCFDDKQGACACICPTSGESVCFSASGDGNGSATLVHCL